MKFDVVINVHLASVDAIKYINERLAKLIERTNKMALTMEDIKAELAEQKLAIAKEKEENAALRKVLADQNAALAAELQALKDSIANGQIVTQEQIQSVIDTVKENDAAIDDISNA